MILKTFYVTKSLTVVLLITALVVSYMAGRNDGLVVGFNDGRMFGSYMATDLIMEGVMKSGNSKLFALGLELPEHYKYRVMHRELERIYQLESFVKWESQQDNYTGSVSELTYKRQLKIIDWITRNGLTSR